VTAALAAGRLECSHLHRRRRLADRDTQQYIANNIPHVAESIASVSGKPSLPPGGSVGPPFVAGQVSVQFKGNTFNETDTSFGSGAFSIQDNTFFTGNNGHVIAPYIEIARRP
jgi:hypothetical protein